jgi:hypothetical protein
MLNHQRSLARRRILITSSGIERRAIVSGLKSGKFYGESYVIICIIQRQKYLFDKYYKRVSTTE